MGEWFDYKIRFANKKESLANALVEKGLAKIEMGGNDNASLRVFVTKIDPGTFATGYTDDGSFESIVIGMPDPYVAYCNRWAPDTRLVYSISKNFPGDIFSCEERCTYDNVSPRSYYLQNGKMVLKNGELVKHAMSDIAPKLVQIQKDAIQISMPIGEEGDLWGKFTLPKNQVTYFTYEKEDHSVGIYGVSLFFTEDSITVNFRNKTEELNIDDLANRYYDSKHNYSRKMSEQITISDIPRSCVRNRDDYYIVTLPCPEEVSASREMSLAVPDYQMQLNCNTATIAIGERGKSRNIRILNEQGEYVNKNTPVPKIKAYYEQAINRTQNNRAELQQEEIDLD